MPNVLQISRGKGKGHNMTCIWGRIGEAEVQLQNIPNLGARRGGSSAVLSALLVPRKDLVCIWVDGSEKILLPPGFNPRTVQSIVSHYV